MASQNPQPSSVKIGFYTMQADGSRRAGIRAPYHPAAVARFRALGGQWNGDVWLFDPRDEARVRDAATAVYGTDGTPSAVVDVRVTLTVARQATLWEGDNNLFLLGRQIARRPYRDARVALGDGVVIVEGRFSGAGGSAKNPALGNLDGITVEVRDVPAVLADQAIAAGWAEEVPGSRREPQAQPAPAPPAAVDPAVALLDAARAALRALTPEQRVRLLTEALDEP